jgi:hypothetical protein
MRLRRTGIVCLQLNEAVRLPLRSRKPMVYRPDEDSAERQRKVTQRGYVQAVVTFVGLVILLLLFRPTPVTLFVSLVLAAVGFWSGFADARSGRLDVPFRVTTNKPPAFRRLLPFLILVSAELSALLHLQWVVAVGNLLFFLTGVTFGIACSIITERKASTPEGR